MAPALSVALAILGAMYLYVGISLICMGYGRLCLGVVAKMVL